MVDSLPATTGQLTRSEVVGADPSQSDRSLGQACTVLMDEGEEEEEEEAAGRVEEEAREREEGWERDVGRGKQEEEERLLGRLIESLTVTRCLRIKLDT